MQTTSFKYQQPGVCLKTEAGKRGKVEEFREIMPGFSY